MLPPASTDPQLFFGVGTGRAGTMALSNILASEPGVTCLHEGKLRHGEVAGKQFLPFLTLENRLAYENPDEAPVFFERTRASLAQIARDAGGTHFGDIAYNYTPFLGPLGRTYPAAKLIVFVRSGIDFVRSATQRSGEDVSPVGWPPLDKSLSRVERFVGLGRFAPRQQDPLSARWPTLDHVARNAWLWAETNRLIFDGISLRPPGTTFVLRYEEFFADPLSAYPKLRQFLEIHAPLSPSTIDLLRTPVNVRTQKILGSFVTWTSIEQEQFREFAGPMMDRLGYSIPAVEDSRD